MHEYIDTNPTLGRKNVNRGNESKIAYNSRDFEPQLRVSASTMLSKATTKYVNIVFLAVLLLIGLAFRARALNAMIL